MWDQVGSTQTGSILALWNSLITRFNGISRAILCVRDDRRCRIF